MPCVWTAHAESPPPNKRPNLLWIMTDQQSAGTLGCYGHPVIQTPALDRLASQGAKFEKHFVAAVPCSPSRATLLTGQYAHTHGVISNGLVLPASMPCLGDILKTAGYTCGWIGKWHLGGKHDSDTARRLVRKNGSFSFEIIPCQLGENTPQHGFTDYWVSGRKDYLNHLLQLGLITAEEARTLIGGHKPIHWRGESHSTIPDDKFLTAFLADKTIEFIRKQKDSSRPFCAAFSIFGPHGPLLLPAPWHERYNSQQVVLPKSFNDTLEGKPPSQRESHNLMRGRFSAEKVRGGIARYYGFVSYIDHQIGRVLDALDQSGLADNTLVLFTTDHGDYLGSHGFMNKGPFLYEDYIHTPLLMRFPGRIAAGAGSPSLFSSIDVLPTVLSMLGLPVPEGLHGMNLLPALSGDPSCARQHVFAEMVSLVAGVKMIRTNEAKLQLRWHPPEMNELYDLQNDPDEMINQIDNPKYAPVVAKLTDQIFGWLESTDDPNLDLVRKGLGGIAVRADNHANHKTAPK